VELRVVVGVSDSEGVDDCDGVWLGLPLVDWLPTTTASAAATAALKETCILSQRKTEGTGS
jgi:hypothetical protein